MQEITYLEPEKVRGCGLTEAEMKHIMDTSTKHMMTMVSGTRAPLYYAGKAFPNNHPACNNFPGLHRSCHAEVVAIPARARLCEEYPRALRVLLAKSAGKSYFVW